MHYRYLILILITFTVAGCADAPKHGAKVEIPTDLYVAIKKRLAKDHPEISKMKGYYCEKIVIGGIASQTSGYEVRVNFTIPPFILNANKPRDNYPSLPRMVFATKENGEWHISDHLDIKAWDEETRDPCQL